MYIVTELFKKYKGGWFESRAGLFMLESWYLLADARWFTVQYALVSSTCKLPVAI